VLSNFSKYDFVIRVFMQERAGPILLYCGIENENHMFFVDDCLCCDVFIGLKCL